MTTPTGLAIHSLRELASLEGPQQDAWVRHLLPPRLLVAFGIDPLTLHNQAAERVVHLHADLEEASVRLEVWRRLADTDPILVIDAADTAIGQIDIHLVAINDPASPRFNIDVDENGQPTYLGSQRRNVGEELRAMQAGLAPGQVRRGLGLVARQLLPRGEVLLIEMGKEYVFAHPLAYHNAILLERWGFDYLYGEQAMRDINRRFRPGGDLRARLDNSTPFRPPAAADTIRGRSWAIHDDILGEPLPGIKLAKRLGHHAGVNTAPGVPY